MWLTFGGGEIETPQKESTRQRHELCATFRTVGLFRHFKKTKDSSSEVPSRRHSRRVAANPLEEVVEAQETRPPDHSLSLRIGGAAPFFARKHPDPLAVEEIRAAADPEDDNAREQLIEHEREDEQHNH